ncbi:helix-turn-helix transcriptional regulator [Sporocytophaga sp.]|uniref:helix-turn-helix domain-containing protein n=1 Tax=Sporocytophaga sp. TaxID=2231183 RepID=UPI0025F8886B|nr:helix-turn-helix transcriptional regulator [Sporocytophaga sp.]
MKRKKNYIRKEEELQAFGKHLRAIRKRKNMTLETLAALSEIEYSQVSRIERGVINTSLSNVFVLAEALEVTYKDLFDF